MTIGILKYLMPDLAKVELVMPDHAKIRMFRFQYGRPTLWAEVRDDDDTKSRKRMFRLAVTGEKILEPVLDYVGSDMKLDGDYVIHCYELWPT